MRSRARWRARSARFPGEERRIALRPWLYRVAHNEAVTILRQRAGVVDSDRVPDPTVAGADSEAEARERLRDLVADLDQLPERQRGALVMRELSGLTYAEIATALGDLHGRGAPGGLRGSCGAAGPGSGARDGV